MARAKRKGTAEEAVNENESVIAEAEPKKNSLAGNYLVSVPKLNLRESAGTDGKVVAILSGEAELQSDGKNKKIDGVTWLSVTCKVLGKEYTGFVNSEFIIKQ